MLMHVSTGSQYKITSDFAKSWNAMACLSTPQTLFYFWRDWRDWRNRAGVMKKKKKQSQEQIRSSSWQKETGLNTDTARMKNAGIEHAMRKWVCEWMNNGIKEDGWREGRKKGTSHPAGNKSGQLSHISACWKHPTATSRNSPMPARTVQLRGAGLTSGGREAEGNCETPSKHCGGEDPQSAQVTRGQRDGDGRKRQA